MTTPKFTPGQTVLTAHSFPVLDATADFLKCEMEKAGRMIASAACANTEKRHGVSVTLEDIQGAVSLYSSAPDLYAALEALLKDYGNLLRAYSDELADDGIAEAPEDDSASVARAALAKARGMKGGA